VNDIIALVHPSLDGCSGKAPPSRSYYHFPNCPLLYRLDHSPVICMETKGNAQRQNASRVYCVYMYPKFDSSLHHNIDRN